MNPDGSLPGRISTGRISPATAASRKRRRRWPRTSPDCDGPTSCASMPFGSRSNSLQARIALSCAARAAAAERKGMLGRIAEFERSLRRNPLPSGAAQAALVAGCARGLTGDREAAVTRPRQAADHFDDNEIGLWASAARYRLGRIAGGEAGENDVAAAVASMRRRAVRSAWRSSWRRAPTDSASAQLGRGGRIRAIGGPALAGQGHAVARRSRRRGRRCDHRHQRGWVSLEPTPSCARARNQERPSNAAPLPVANLRQVLAVLADVLLVLDELVLELLLQVDAPVARLR